MFPINMIGGGFQHDVCSSALNKNKYTEWNKSDHSAKVSIYIDTAIYDGITDGSTKDKYAWLAESSAIHPGVYSYIKENYSELIKTYTYIFTHDKSLLTLGDKVKFVPANACTWIQNKQIYPKSKLVSMIASNKNWTKGHLKRHQVRERFGNSIDFYGRGYGDKELPWTYTEWYGEESGKLLGLRDYMFSIAIENDDYPSIFCEKILDCFATGTVPIFWGTPDIGEYFNADGIIMLTDDFSINDLTPDLYTSKLSAINDNYERTLSWNTSEDFLYLNYIKPLHG